VTDGAVLPIVHFNGYKIANPTLLARITRKELEQLFRGHGWTPYFVEGHEPELMHEAMAATPQWSRSKHSSRTPVFTATSHVHAGG
jgi:xylulose-5-phosphate/fructose-6-phosphate phosphoketolase